MNMMSGFSRNGRELEQALREFLEFLLRFLRDHNRNTDYEQNFVVRDGVIRFDHAVLNGPERDSFIRSLLLANQAFAEASLRFFPVDFAQPCFTKGLSFDLQAQNIYNWRPPPAHTYLREVLVKHGELIGEQFFVRRSSPAHRDPLSYSVQPWLELPGVWVGLRPNPSRTYPTLGHGFQGHALEELRLIEKEFSDPRFRLARAVETNQVWLLFDFREGKDVQ